MSAFNTAIQSLIQKTATGNALGATWKPLGEGKDSTITDLTQDLPGLTYAITTAVAADFATIKLGLWQGEEDDKERIKMNPALTSLRYPNSDTSGYELFQQYSMYMDTVGEVFWHIMPVKGTRMLNIRTLNPLALREIQYDKAGNPTQYRFYNSDSETDIRYNPEEVIHFKNINLGDLQRGYSPFNPVKKAIDASEGAMEYNNRFFQNDATPSLILEVVSKLTQEGRARIKTAWNALFRGANKAHKAAVIDGAQMKVHQLSGSLKDMAFGDLFSETNKALLSNWRLSKTIIGQSEDVNRATIEGADYNYAKRVLSPKMDAFVSALNTQFLPLFFDKGDIVLKDIRFEYVSPVVEDIESKFQVANMGVSGKPFLTINEARTVVGLPKMEGEEYDEIPSIEPEPLMIEEPDTSEEEKKIDLLTEKLQSTTEDLKAMEEYDEVKALEKEEIAKDHEQKAIKAENAVEKEIKKFFSEQEDRFLKRLRETTPKSLKKTYNPFNEGAEATAMVTFLRSIYKKVARAAWSEANRRVGASVPGFESLIEEAVEQISIQSANEVQQTTFQDLQVVLEEAASEGLGANQTAARIGDLYSEYRGKRARLIARTETNAIISQATVMNYDTAEAEGIIKGRSWLPVGDESTRTAHAEAETQGVKTQGETWELDGSQARFPGDPLLPIEQRANCRCTLIPEV